MASKLSAYTTKELSKRTWSDFKKLFSQGNGWDFCWCMHFQRARESPGSRKLRARAEKSVRNRREKHQLVLDGRAHGILVYANGEPVGWCQYGPSGELPRIDKSPHYRGPGAKSENAKLWRITCFVTDKKHRRRGVAAAALEAALESIKRQGGGIVEAFPLIPWEELRRSEIRRRGHAPCFGNSSTHGTKSMFEKQGFQAVWPFGRLNVLMRKTI